KLHTAIAQIVADGAVEVASHLELLVGLDREHEVADRHVLFYAARRFAESVAATQPTVLVFEDIHWADAGTLDLLEMLAARLRDVPVMLLALARPTLLAERAGWGGGLPAYTALPLGTLDAADAAKLASQLLGVEAARVNAERIVGAA